MPPASASLYRRHRPRSFADVVGQEHVVRTLSNAIEQDKVHHAYLFVGSRGTGKTSMAKILAASLNCVNGPTVSPCGECDSCVSIASATSLDVIEMDAASNNSVDDIRDLREKVAYAPVSGRHKVYILDEAHMLSTEAWNAFLKTLEEPPPHTIFVLATTEANKVLPTVVDRCHRFDFGRPTVAQITKVLRRTADAEAIAIPDEACALIARSATGSFRDALGTLEQLVAYSGASIELDDVLAVLGAADADLLFGAIDAVAAGDARSALLAAARLADSGRDIGRFFGDLEAHARSLMIVQTLGGEVPPEISVTAEQDERLREQAARVSPTDVVRVLDLIAVGLRAMKDGSDARTQLELALVKAAVPKVDNSAKALQSRLERLEAGRPAPTPARRPGRQERGRPRHRRRPRRAHERRIEGGRPSGRARRGAASGRRLAARPSGRPLRARPFGGPRPGAFGRRRRGRRSPGAGAGGGRGGARPRRLRRAVAGRHRVDPGGAAAAGGAPQGRPPLGARQRGADARVGRDGRAVQAQGRGRRQPRADRPRDPGGHRRRPAARPRAGGRHPRGERADALARRARRALRGRVRGRDPGRPGGDVLMPPQPNMQKMMQQVQKMQQEMMAAQESLKNERVEASAGGGMVKVVATGELHIESVTIDPDAVDPEDVEMLQDTVLAAVNEALRSAQELAADKMGAATGGLGGPGGLGGLGLPGL